MRVDERKFNDRLAKLYGLIIRDPQRGSLLISTPTRNSPLIRSYYSY